MKKFLKVFLVFLLMACMLITASYAETEENISEALIKEENEISESNDFVLEDDGIMTLALSDYTYSDNQDGTITITKYSGTETVVTIPSTIDGKTVTSIGKAAFYQRSLITSIEIPNTVKTLEEGAFADCVSLSNITIGNSVTKIEAYVFQKNKFSEIRIPASVNSIDASAFFNCNNLAKFDIDSSNATYTSIDGIMFSKDKTTLFKYPQAKTNTSYTIPSTVKTLENESFRFNNYLTSITIPGSVNTIKDWVFNNCTALTSITLPNTITNLGNGPFQYCTSLTSAVINCNIPKLSYSMFKECTNLTSADFSNCSAKITDSRVFYECPNLTTVKLPNKLENLVDYTFSFCNKITTLSIPSTVIKIGGKFAYESPNLKNYKVPNGLLSDGEGGYVKAVNVTVSGNLKYDYAKEVLNIVNSERAKAGLGLLTLDQSLTESAMERAVETSLLFDHTRPTTSDCFSINSKANGENIAAGQRTPTAVMNTWMNSSGHKANILGSSYNSIGIGCFEEDGMFYWVQLFGNSAGSGNVESGSKAITKTKPIYWNYVKKLSSNLSKSSNTFNVGDTKKVDAYLVNSGWEYTGVTVTGSEVKFSSSNSSVVSISENGDLKAVGAGNANITITLAGASQSFPVTVNGYSNGGNNNNSGYSSEQLMNLVFDYKFYADTYGDLKAVFGYNESALRNHFLTCGVKEGRKSSPVFDVSYYLSNNEDLKKAFGNKNYEVALNHFISCGYKELRKSSNEYWGAYYVNKNSDLRHMDEYTLMVHYLGYGRNEGRKANEGNVNIMYAKEDITNSLFNARFYYDLYADLRSVIGYNESALREHWLTCGIKEGRVASVVFDARYYLNNYADLRNAFGSKNYEAAYHHFIANGIHEGRKASEYFDARYYLNKYKDLTNVFGKSYSSGLIHFVNCGMNESRIGSSTFSIYKYRTNYADLRSAFGGNILAYYEHYILSGKAEKRKAN